MKTYNSAHPTGKPAQPGRLRTAICFAGLLALGAAPSQAANILKSDTTTMNAASDWSGTTPTSASIGEFGSIPQAATLLDMTLGGPVTLGGLQLDASENGPLTINDANLLTLGSSGIFDTNNATLNNPVTLSSAQTWDVNAGNTLTISGQVTGSYAITVPGPGTINLSNTSTTTNNYGALIVNGGTLNFTNWLFPSYGSAYKLVQTAGTVTFNSIQTIVGGDGTFVDITGGSLTGNSLNMWRTDNSVGATVTDAAPLAGSTTEGFYVNGAGATVQLGYLGVAAFGPAPGGGGVSGAASGTARIDNGTVMVGKLGLADTTGGAHYSAFQVNGGSLAVTDTNTGILIARNVSSSRTYGELYLSGGTTTLGAVTFGSPQDIAGSTSSTGWVLVKGGTLYIGNGGVTNASDVANAASDPYSANFHLYSGLLGATAPWLSTVPVVLSGSASTPFTIQAADASGNANNITLGAGLSGSGALTKTGGGTLTLSNANTYVGPTLITAGTLAIGINGTLASPTITLTSGAVLDTTGAGGVTLASGTTLTGGRTSSPATDINGGLINNGTINVAGTGTIGTLTVNGNLTLSGGTVVFDLSSTYNGANDQVVLTGAGSTLDYTGGSISINSAGILDTTHDYVLFNTPGIVTGAFTSVPLVWLGTTPGNAPDYSIISTGTAVVLHYTPPAVSASSKSATPSTVVRNQATVLSVTGSPGPGGTAMNSITAVLTSLGGSSVPLVDTGNHLTFTNTIVIPASDTIFGAASVEIALVDNNNNSGFSSVPLTITAPVTETWNGNDSANNYNWSDNPNWANVNGAYAPGLTGDLVVFTGAKNAPVLDQAYSVSGLTFNSSASAFTLTSSGTTLTLTGGVTNSSAQVQTLNLPLALSATVTVNSDVAGLAIPGVISGTGSLTETGPGTNTLSGTNTFTGGASLNGGVVNLDVAETAGASGPLGEVGPISFGGGTLQYSSANTYDYSSRFSAAPNNAYNIDLGGQSVTFASGLLSTNGTLTVNNGTLTLAGASAFTGNIVVNNATLLDSLGENQDAVHTTSGLGNLAVSGRTVTINNNSTVEFDAAGALGGGSDGCAVSFIINAGGLLTSSSAYHNNVVGNIVLNGGTLTAGSVSTYEYFQSIELGGTMTVGGTSPSTISQSGSGTGSGFNLGINTNWVTGVIVSTNFIFNVGSTGAGPGNPDLLVPAVLADISGANGVNSYAGSTTLVKTGAGYLQLSGANLYTGDTVVSNGILEIASGGAVLSTNLFDDGGTLEIDGGTAISALNLIDNAGTVTLGNGVSLSTVTNVFVANGAKLDTSALGTGGLTLAAYQTLTAGNTSHPAVTNLNGDLTADGTLSIAGPSVAGTLTQNGNLFFNPGGTVVFDLSSSISGANDQVVLTGGGNLTAGDITIGINSAGTLDSHDYVLFNVTGGGSVTGSFYPTPVWLGTTPANASHYYIETVGTTVVLHYITGTPPYASSATVSPASVVRGHNVTFSVTGVPGSGASSISSVALNLTALGGSASQTLPNTGGNTFGATILVGPASSTGNLSLPVFITDNNNTLGATNILLTVNATTETWSGNDSANNYNWSDNANWVSGLAPGYVGDSLIFTGSKTAPVLDQSYSVPALTFNNAASSFTLTSSGGTLTLTGSLTNNSAYLQTLNLPVALNGAVTLNVGAAGLAVPGSISGTGGLVELGAGTNTLSGANTFSGGVFLKGGVVNLDAGENAGVSGPLGTNGPIQFGGGILQFSSANQGDYSSRVSTNANQAVNLDLAGQSVTFASALTSSNGSLTVADSVGNGTLTLSTAGSSFSGNVTVNSGTVVASAVAANTPTTTALGAQSAGRTITVNSGASLTLSGNNIFGNTPATSIPSLVVNGGALNTALFNSFGLSGSGTNGLTLQNGAVLDATGASPSPYFAGNFGDLVTVNGTSGSSITGEQLDLWNGTSTGTGTGGSTTFNVASTGAGPDLVVTAPLGDTGYSGTAAKAGLVKTGSGILQLDAANTFTGGTVVSNGILNGAGFLASSVRVAPSGGLGAGDVGPTVGTLTISSNLTLQGSVTLRISATGGSPQQPDQITVGGNITYGGTLVVNNITSDRSPLELGYTFQLFNVTGTVAGNFAGISGSPGGSLGYSFNPANGVLSVVAASVPVAGFSGSPASIFKGQSVVFVDASSGTINRWIWNFGDDVSVTNGSNASVSHTYTNVGTYTVSLTANGPAGSNTKTLMGYVVVKPNPVLGNTVLTGNTLIVGGANGLAGVQYRILTSTNLTLPLASWTPVYTNVFAPDGSYGYTNSAATGNQSFYLLVSP